MSRLLWEDWVEIYCNSQFKFNIEFLSSFVLPVEENAGISIQYLQTIYMNTRYF